MRGGLARLDRSQNPILERLFLCQASTSFTSRPLKEQRGFCPVSSELWGSSDRDREPIVVVTRTADYPVGVGVLGIPRSGDRYDCRMSRRDSDRKCLIGNDGASVEKICLGDRGCSVSDILYCHPDGG